MIVGGIAVFNPALKTARLRFDTNLELVNKSQISNNFTDETLKAGAELSVD